MAQPTSAGRAGRLLLEFEAVMEQFLETERELMALYLSRRAGTAIGPARVFEAPAHPSAPSYGDAVAAPAVAPSEAGPPPVADEPAARSPEPRSDRLLRLTPSIVSRPAGEASASLAAGHTVVLTDDRRGICARVAERLKNAGRRVAIITTDESLAATPDVYVSTLGSEAEVQRVVQAIAAAGAPVAALLHLQPLSPWPATDVFDVAECSARLALETGALFLLAKALAPSLEAAASQGGSAVMAATAMGGAFGCPTPAGSICRPTHGGVTGFMKCLALEWPSVRARTIDLNLSESTDVLADAIFDEIRQGGGDVEIGYFQGSRIGLQMMEMPSVLDPAFTLASDAVVLATGGARGITADICLEIAERFQPLFVLVGQTPLPDPVEPAATAALAGAALRRALTDRLKQERAQVTPAMVERAYRQLLKDREIRHTVSALVAAGARVQYAAVDVSDADAFGALVDEVYAAHGRIDAVVHGAGAIEDKLIKDKPLDSFNRVLKIKTASAFVLAQRLRPESLRWVVFFTSVAGRFGNRGQSDYAAANEVLNKLAAELNRRWPARVCAINWAPWDSGMVSPELKREFEKRGIGLIARMAGRRAFWEEIQQPRTDAPEVVIAPADGISLAAPVPIARAAAEPIDAAPLLKHASRGRVTGGSVQFSRVLDPAVDRYLLDHCLDGHPVLPLAVATELMAEAAQAVWPDLVVVSVRNLQLLKGLVVDAPVPVVISVRPPVHVDDHGRTQADVEIATPSLSPPIRYRGVVELASRMPPPPLFPGADAGLTPLPMSVEEAYQRWTFHGPLFRRITSIAGTSPEWIVGRIESPSRSTGITGVARAAWIIDPFVFDAALQLQLIWSRAVNDTTALPARFQAFHRYGRLCDQALTTYVQVETLAGGNALRSEFHFVDPAGQVLAVLTGMEVSCSAALNRLAPERPGGAS